MIDAKQAILIAKAKAAEILNQVAHNVEEIERESYKGRDTWSITLSFPLDLPHLASGIGFVGPLQYKRFLVDVETGELLAMKIREVAAQ
jgi:hypothetical protein